jgi:type IX secretion system PorP/SprF family membrane protein
LPDYFSKIDLKPDMHILKRVLFVFIMIFSFSVLKAQQSPLNTVSVWVFTPYVYNPAIIGSKDFLSVNLNSGFQGKSNSQIISWNARFSKTNSGYFSSPDIMKFKNFGIGGSVFRDFNGISKNIGLSLAGSYQIPLSTRELSFLSFGVSVKGVYNTLNVSSIDSGISSKKTFYPNIDAGIYYFGTNFFTGISTTNMLGSPEKNDSLYILRIPASRQYFLVAGYKILISKPLNIVLEPSLLVSANDSTLRKSSYNFNPVLRLYLENFCFGTSYNTDGKISFFTQYRYPTFYVGAYFEISEKSPFFKKSPIVEFTLGINIRSDKSRLSGHTHW